MSDAGIFVFLGFMALALVGPLSARRRLPGAVSCVSPRRRQWVHFVGIGGTGMSALALLALKQGWKVSGSDSSLNNRLESLKNDGALVFSGHDQENVRGMPDALVVSSAIPVDNVEVEAARELGVPVFKRGDWLGRITKGFELVAVAGTHGKSTTAAMLAVCLRILGEDVTAIVGADVPQFVGGANALVGGGRLFVLEADEYDACFLSVSPSIAVVTNVEWEHVDMFPDEASVRDMFTRFTRKVNPGGFLVIYGDSVGTQSLIAQTKQSREPGHAFASHLNVVTYGLDEGNCWQATMLTPNVEGGTDYLAVHNNKPVARVTLMLPGVHNVLNSLAAVAVIAILASKGKRANDQLEARVEAAEAAAKALGTFVGLRRRFEFVGTVLQCDIYDDYAHHPTEVRAVLQAARQRFQDGQQIWVVFQPHKYSRLAKLLRPFSAAFRDADRVIVTEVYSAGEQDRWGISGADLAAAITGPPSVYIPTLDEVVARLFWELATMQGIDPDKSNVKVVLLVLGAGTKSLDTFVLSGAAEIFERRR